MRPIEPPGERQIKSADELTVGVPDARDIPQITELYRAVAAVPGGLARSAGEIDEDFIRHNLTASQQRGIALVARAQNRIVGEIHAYRPVPVVFAHVLSDLTIAVDPRFQGHGVGRILFSTLLAEVEARHPQILRVELLARESNQRAIRFYESLGFRAEGRLSNRVRSVEGGFEADLAMAWLRRSPSAA